MTELSQRETLRREVLADLEDAEGWLETARQLWGDNDERTVYALVRRDAARRRAVREQFLR